jgi:IS30 family transposase
MQPYTHFTLSERECLQELLKEGKNQSQIAKVLNRSRSSISRELKRNSNKDNSYNSWRATTLYIIRRKDCRRKYRLTSDKRLYDWVNEKLQLFWSPESIAERYKKRNPGEKLSHSTIYRAVKLQLLPNILPKTHLRRRGKRKYGNRSKFNTIKPDYTIHERPVETENRDRIGDWEGDTIVGKRGCALTAVDRKSRYLCAEISVTHSSENIKNAMITALSGKKVNTLTLDNGSEFAKHREFAKELETTVFFADPHSPWQRGTNENTNGLLRFFFPKGTNFSLVSNEDFQKVVDLINDRPRKCLDWLSSREVFFSKCCI